MRRWDQFYFDYQECGEPGSGRSSDVVIDNPAGFIWRFRGSDKYLVKYLQQSRSSENKNSSSLNTWLTEKNFLKNHLLVVLHFLTFFTSYSRDKLVKDHRSAKQQNMQKLFPKYAWQGAETEFLIMSTSLAWLKIFEQCWLMVKIWVFCRDIICLQHWWGTTIAERTTRFFGYIFSFNEIIHYY